MTDELCAICRRRPAVSREGWCRPCLRAKLRERFGPVGAGNHAGANRTKEHRQDMSSEPSPSQENAIRALEA